MSIMFLCMRTTVDINDDLLIELKRLAAQSHRSLRDLIEEALRADLAAGEQPAAPIRLVRPLLEVTRAEVEAYCAEHSLAPRHDRSNEDEAILRNRLRRRLLPTLETYNPSLRTTILRTARALADDYAYLQGEVARLWPTLAQETADAVAFDLATW